MNDYENYLIEKSLIFTSRSGKIGNSGLSKIITKLLFPTESKNTIPGAC